MQKDNLGLIATGSENTATATEKGVIVVESLVSSQLSFSGPSPHQAAHLCRTVRQGTRGMQPQNLAADACPLSLSAAAAHSFQ